MVLNLAVAWFVISVGRFAWDCRRSLHVWVVGVCFVWCKADQFGGFEWWGLSGSRGLG